MPEIPSGGALRGPTNAPTPRSSEPAMVAIASMGVEAMSAASSRHDRSWSAAETTALRQAAGLKPVGVNRASVGTHLIAAAAAAGGYPSWCNRLGSKPAFAREPASLKLPVPRPKPAEKRLVAEDSESA